MEHFIWASVALALIVVINYRLGQYFNPPYQDDLQAIKSIMDTERRQVNELKQKVNSLMVDRGFRDE